MDNLEKRALWPGWETVRLIGRGSFGAVYEIQRDVFGNVEKAALKVISIPQAEGDVEELRSDGFDDESITDTFKAQLRGIVDEYSMMRKLNGSANVVNCDDVRYVQHDDGIGWTILIKMELLTPLSKALPEQIPPEMAVKIGTDISKALVLCKRFNIIHRDIKPQNIFLSDLGDYKLGDFGVAKTVEKTRGGTKIGTYKYMAPEVYNNQPYGQGADVYSLGLVMYWLLNERRMPFVPLPPVKLRAGMEEEGRERRLKGERVPAPHHGSEELKRIVLKAVAYDPRDRYQTAEELLRDLERLPKEEAEGDVPASTDRPAEQGRRNDPWEKDPRPAGNEAARTEYERPARFEADATVRDRVGGAPAPAFSAPAAPAPEAPAYSASGWGPAPASEAPAYSASGWGPAPASEAPAYSASGWGPEPGFGQKPAPAPEAPAYSASGWPSAPAYEQSDRFDAEETVRSTYRPPSAPAFGQGAQQDYEEATVRSSYTPGAPSQRAGSNGFGGPSGYRPPVSSAEPDGEATIGVAYRRPTPPKQESQPLPWKAPELPRKEDKPAPPPAKKKAVSDGKKKKRVLLFGFLGLLLLAALGVGAYFLFFAGDAAPAQEVQTVALTAAEKKEIGENAQMAASARSQRNQAGVMPFLFGLAKGNSDIRLISMGNNSGVYTMRYNLKGNATGDTNLKVLRTDPMAGSAIQNTTAIHVELSSSYIPQSAVYFHAFYNSDGSIRKGVFLDKNGGVVRTILYSYEKLANGNTLMREETYNAKEVLVDLWTIEFKGDSYLRSTTDKEDRWMKQTHYKPSGKQLKEYIWDGDWDN
jgi:serine/threonine protein kinase